MVGGNFLLVFSGPFWNHLCLEQRTLKAGSVSCVVDRMQKPWFDDDHVSPIDFCKSLLYPIPLIFRTTLMVKCWGS